MYSKVTIIGNLGADPEMRYMPDGTAVTNFSVATNRTWNDRDGEKHEETTWWRVSAWGKQAEVCHQYLKKGRQVLVEGRMRPDENGGPRVWTSNDGTPRASFEVTADIVKFLQGMASEPNDGFGEEDEIPF